MPARIEAMEQAEIDSLAEKWSGIGNAAMDAVWNLHIAEWRVSRSKAKLKLAKMWLMYCIACGDWSVKPTRPVTRWRIKAERAEAVIVTAQEEERVASLAYEALLAEIEQVKERNDK